MLLNAIFRSSSTKEREERFSPERLPNKKNQAEQPQKKQQAARS